MIFLLLKCFLNIGQSTSTIQYTMAISSLVTPAYRVILNPGDEHVRYSGRVKMLTKEEANAVREMVKNEVGKTVARFGGNLLGGEEYEIMSTFPHIHDIDTFFNEVKNKSVSFDAYFSERVKRIASQEKQTASQEKQTQKYQCSPAMATCAGLYHPPSSL